MLHLDSRERCQSVVLCEGVLKQRRERYIPVTIATLPARRPEPVCTSCRPPDAIVLLSSMGSWGSEVGGSF